jgi:flagella basal body P-ring formation protein FlgA
MNFIKKINSIINIGFSFPSFTPASILAVLPALPSVAVSFRLFIILSALSIITGLAAITGINPADAAGRAAAGNIAVTLELKPKLSANEGEITLGDICLIKISPGFKIDADKTGRIKMGFAPAPLVERRIYKFEVDNIIRQKLEFPDGCTYLITGSDYCVINAFAGGETRRSAKNYNASDSLDLNKQLKINLEKKISALFIERYADKYKLGPGDKIISTITFGLNRAAVKRISSYDELKIDMLGYKASAATVAVKYEAELIAKLYAKIIRKTTAAVAAEKIPKNSIIDINKIKTSEIEIIAEKYHELFLINDIPEANEELVRAAENNLEFSKNIAAGEVIKKSFLKKKLLVKAGQIVDLYIKTSRSSMSISASASKGGGAGDIIEVINLKTRKKYKAVIVDEGAVESVDKY